MKYLTARIAIHAAYLTGEKGMDPAKLKEGFGGTLTDRDWRIVDHVEKGFIQKAMDNLKQREPVLYAWNLFAYAPPGTGHGFERSRLLQWMLDKYSSETGEQALLEPRLPMLARVAMQEYSIVDRSGKQGRRIPYSDFERLLGLGSGEYKAGSRWHRAYWKFYDYCKSLPEDSLPPIARVIGMMVDCSEGDAEAHLRLQRELGVVA
ncbi:hypothetical protein [uncultured Gilvimarinus sp.]|uniref:hypothetical protein n=1 Tax=uncultured Gilvimarinus sp. TaxID=1689143 RepID=UPI0030EB5AC7|tara:strand:+ start:1486 stop:2103 length:618 start_codon:yes stop_codon:yes gene_type:complete